ncbi:hypothetical protein R50072_27400 [Simiduia litorea]|uniref:DUF3313 family protein n=1 Tax=Simiduia litorea TaxID=1435348 RepID=UPI0036F2CFB5
MLHIHRTIKIVCAIGLTLAAQLSFAQKPMDVQYVRPGVDFSAYTQVVLHPLDLSKAKVVPPAWAEDKSPKVWNLEGRDVAAVQALYHDAIKTEVEKDARFKVVPFTGPGILEVEVKITSLTPFAAKDEKVMTRGSGEITVQVEMIDGATGDLLAIIAGDQQVGEKFQQASIDTDRANVAGLFKVWGERLLAQLQASQR